MGTWSEPVEGREVCQPFMKGRSRGLVKGRSITEGLAFPERGNLVYTPAELSRAKPPSAANSKYGAEEETSSDEMSAAGQPEVCGCSGLPLPRLGRLCLGRRIPGGQSGPYGRLSSLSRR